MNSEHPNINNADWRLQAVTTLAKEFTSPWTKKTYPIGTRIELVSNLLFKGSVLSIPVPNMASLFLNLSYSLWDESQEIIKSTDFITKKEDRLSIKDDSELFNYLEKRMGSIVFAFTALESFANESIPEEYQMKGNELDSVPNNLKVGVLNRDQIERFVNLGEKLDKVLPKIFNIKSPKGSGVWENYAKIKKIRDRIIHLKSIDRKSSSVEDDTIWKELVIDEHRNIASLTKDIINYYDLKEKTPRWIKKWPF